MKDFKFVCYPFLEEDDWTSDYEVMTDGLSSEIAFAASLNSGEVKADLETLIRIVLDLNPMIRKQDSQIICFLKNELIDLYSKYETEFDSFYLPIGNTSSTSISKLRMHCKLIIRLIYKNDKTQRELLDIFHLMTNLFHHMYLKTSKDRHKFISKSYK